MSRFDSRREESRREREAIDASIGAPRPIRPFNAAQRRALVFALAAFLICIAVMLARNDSHVSDPMPAEGARFDELVDKLDPNVADVASLSALPGFGARRANDLVEYRDRVRTSDRSRVAFRSADDLLRVRGIGVAISKQIEPYLVFPAAVPSTMSTTR